MKKIISIVVIFISLFICLPASGQNVGINATGNAPHSSAILDVESTTKGMLIPRMTTAQRASIASPATGLLVFDNTTGSCWFKGAKSCRL